MHRARTRLMSDPLRRPQGRNPRQGTDPGQRGAWRHRCLLPRPTRVTRHQPNHRRSSNALSPNVGPTTPASSEPLRPQSGERHPTRRSQTWSWGRARARSVLDPLRPHLHRARTRLMLDPLRQRLRRCHLPLRGRNPRGRNLMRRNRPRWEVPPPSSRRGFRQPGGLPSSLWLLPSA